MGRIRFLPVLLTLGLVASIPAASTAGPGDECGSLCAGGTTDNESAWADWNGGHVDVNQRTTKWWPGGASVQSNTESWVGISLWDPNTGFNYYNCGYGPLPAGALTKNADGSLTLVFQHPDDPSCNANVTWTPTDEPGQVYTNTFSRLDPAGGGFEAGAWASTGRRAAATGTAAWVPFDIQPDSEWGWAEIASGVGGCATNSFCGF